tara:strand:- start:141 stop:437 length:297 start_codon:yes stop_codon:yes gene_type:complete
MFHQAINSAYRFEMQSLSARFVLLNMLGRFSREDAKALRVMVIDDTFETQFKSGRAEIHQQTGAQLLMNLEPAVDRDGRQIFKLLSQLPTSSRLGVFA